MTDLASLSRTPAANVPRPPLRWKTRVLLPAVILAAVGGLLFVSAREAFLPSIEVAVAPVVSKPVSAQAGNTADAPATSVAVQAPGWIEADPFAVSVPALADGVIQEVLVLEGARIQPNQVIARMVDADARLGVARAQAELSERRAELDRARATLAAEQARADEVRDEVRRKKDLVESHAIAEGQYARLELRLKAQEATAAAAAAEVAQAQAALKTAEVALDAAQLTLDRMEIHSPVGGVVLARNVEPGTRISMNAPGADARGMGIIRVYDPAHLQVRVEVPIADAAKVGVGQAAEIISEALPDRVFKGKVSRLVHEANIQRNTVQVKIAIEDPDATLKPEMLTRVRIMGSAPRTSPTASTGTHPTHAPGTRLMAPKSAVIEVQNDTGHVWVVDLPSGSARKAAVKLGPVDGDWLELTEGVRPGDRLILPPHTGLTQGAKVRVAAAPAPEGAH